MDETGTDMIRAVSFPICPGAVTTDMSEPILNNSDIQMPPEMVVKTVDEGSEHVLARIDEGTRETNGLVQWDGQVIPW
jgi:hypothetical protein